MTWSASVGTCSGRTSIPRAAAARNPSSPSSARTASRAACANAARVGRRRPATTRHWSSTQPRTAARRGRPDLVGRRSSPGQAGRTPTSTSSRPRRQSSRLPILVESTVVVSGPQQLGGLHVERHRERERAGQVARHCFGLGENRSGRPSSAQGQQPLPVGDAGMRRRPRVVRGRGQRGGFPERLHGRLAGTGEQLPRTEQQERIGQDRRVRGPCQGDRFRGGRGRAGQISGRVSQTAGDQLQVRPVRGRERCAAGVGADPAHPFQPLAGRTAQRPGQPCVGQQPGRLTEPMGVDQTLQRGSQVRGLA